MPLAYTEHREKHDKYAFNANFAMSCTTHLLKYIHTYIYFSAPLQSPCNHQAQNNRAIKKR